MQGTISMENSNQGQDSGYFLWLCDWHHVTWLVDGYLRRQSQVNSVLKEQVFGQVYCQQETLHKRKTFSRVSPLSLWKVIAYTVRRTRLFFGGRKSWVCISSATHASFDWDQTSLQLEGVWRESRLSVHITICMYEVNEYVWCM